MHEAGALGRQALVADADDFAANVMPIIESLRVRGPGSKTRQSDQHAGGGRSLIAEADAFAANVIPIIESLRSSGVTDLRGLAAALNTRGVRTVRGGRWHVSNVKNVIDRAALL